jgi:hypothetical protein
LDEFLEAGQEKIGFALRQVESGKKVADVCREMGVSPQALHITTYWRIGSGSERRQVLERLTGFSHPWTLGA